MSRAPIGRTLLTCLAFFGAAAVARQAYGQVTLDGTANTDFRGPVPFDGTNYDIRAELGHREGANLFHSFETSRSRPVSAPPSRARTTSATSSAG